MNMKNDYGDGRKTLVNEIGVWIEGELERVKVLRSKIPRDTIDPEQTHKRATLSGNVIALCKVRALLNKKVVRMAAR